MENKDTVTIVLAASATRDKTAALKLFAAPYLCLFAAGGLAFHAAKGHLWDVVVGLEERGAFACVA